MIDDWQIPGIGEERLGHNAVGKFPDLCCANLKPDVLIAVADDSPLQDCPLEAVSEPAERRNFVSRSPINRSPLFYQLEETSSASYLQRTEWNARDTDGTVIFTLAAKLTGGSLRTAEFARKHGKPCIHLSRSGGPYISAEHLQQFVGKHRIRVLNVAGSRGSKEPDLHEWVVVVLEDALFS